MKTLFLTIAALLITVASFAQSNNKIVKTFPCHDYNSNIYQQKIKTIDSLKKHGFVLTGIRVDNTYKQKGHNTQVLTFFKVK